ncbi:HlyD family type I secretion periplasmic adaptor subunit [Paraferrimonas sp. SM1919]|uniref:HlyD family type I secretion periplasmic adaptor subunit n=1 Tax=Paraferrimonas sp. SM1919 TaxID=2662263 RepID=UPI0013D7C83F|nr:HlyD family type I secretion periplasmic adaptor subunit [Paraferrimonas sp. SM1919]
MAPNTPLANTATSLNSQRLLSIGWMVFAFGFIGLLLWSSLAPLSSASIASGRLITEVETQAIQHHSGGVIKEIWIKEGQHVDAGEPLLSLSDPILEGQLLQYSSRTFQLKTIIKRLDAQNSGKDFSCPNFSALSPEQKLFCQEQQLLLQQKLAGYQQTLHMFEQQIAQINNDKNSAQSWLDNYQQALVILDEEILANEELLEKGYVSKLSYLQLKRQRTNLVAQISEQQQKIQKSQNKNNELQAKINSHISQFNQQTAEQKQELSKELSAVNEQLITIKALNERIIIRSPTKGNILNLQHHTQGGVIGAGDTIAEVVPEDSRIIAQVMINPKDIESVHAGLIAKVRLLSYSFREAQAIDGELIHISADSILDQSSGRHFYQGKIILAPNNANLAEVALKPGMPVQTQIILKPRSLLDYLISPLSSSLERGLRES